MEHDKDVEASIAYGHPEEVDVKDHGIAHERELQTEEQDIAKIERVYR